MEHEHTVGSITITPPAGSLMLTGYPPVVTQSNIPHLPTYGNVQRPRGMELRAARSRALGATPNAGHKLHAAAALRSRCVRYVGWGGHCAGGDPRRCSSSALFEKQRETSKRLHDHQVEQSKRQHEAEVRFHDERLAAYVEFAGAVVLLSAFARMWAGGSRSYIAPFTATKGLDFGPYTRSMARVRMLAKTAVLERVKRVNDLVAMLTDEGLRADAAAEISTELSDAVAAFELGGPARARNQVDATPLLGGSGRYPRTSTPKNVLTL